MCNLTTFDYEIFVDGEPRAKQSFTVKTSKGRIFGYTDQRIKTWNDIIAMNVKQTFQREAFNCPLEVNLVFYISNKRKIDCDNLSKLVLDSIQGIIYLNDNSIVDLHIHKRISKNKPGVLIQVLAKKEV